MAQAMYLLLGYVRRNSLKDEDDKSKQNVRSMDSLFSSP